MNPKINLVDKTHTIARYVVVTALEFHLPRLLLGHKIMREVCFNVPSTFLIIYCGFAVSNQMSTCFLCILCVFHHHTNVSCHWIGELSDL